MVDGRHDDELHDDGLAISQSGQGSAKLMDDTFELPMQHHFINTANQFS